MTSRGSVGEIAPAVVLGASGFIGSHLTNALRARGVATRTFGRTAGRVDVAGDLTDSAALARVLVGARTVFHLAATAHDRSAAAAREHARVGVGGTRAVLAAAAVAGIERFVFVSSLAVYGSSWTGVRGEDAALAPDTPYGHAKAEAESLVREWGAADRRRHVAIVRPAMVYGAGAKGNLPRLLNAIARGICPPIPRSAARRSLIEIGQLVDFLILVAEDARANGLTFNAADPQPVSTGEMYESLVRAFGKTVPRWRVPIVVFAAAARAGSAFERISGRSPFTRRAFRTLFGGAVVSTARAEEVCGWRSAASFADSAPMLVDGFRVD